MGQGRPVPRNLTTNQTPREEPKMIQAITFEPFKIDKKEIDPKYRRYLLLMKFYGEDEYLNFFEIITGREEVYQYLKENIKDYDPNISLIMTDDMTLDEAVTIIQFIQHLKDIEVVNDELDLDDYREDKSADVIEREIEEVKSNFDVGYDELLANIERMID